MRTLVDIVIGWGPMLLLIGLWIYFIRRSGGMKQGQYFDEVRGYMSEHIAETKRLNSNLERIAEALEKRHSTAHEAQRDAEKEPSSNGI